MENDLRTLRSRNESARDAIDVHGGGEAAGAEAILARCVTPPGGQNQMGAMVPVMIDSTEQEGAACTYTPVPGASDFQAVNLGAGTPVANSTVAVCALVGGRWSYRYDG